MAFVITSDSEDANRLDHVDFGELTKSETADCFIFYGVSESFYGVFQLQMITHVTRTKTV